ncbi:MAG: aspartate aminotransferase [Epulopiscium sp.]|uniref:Aminotransferase n=1 Tax=Defluviitalea raffinosedens TaxID=1450156 RepID=A0A7C8LKN4_9FIRM|nr:pyridoxal phosphate-dependent aminotransferase [Defluviitalea raffinosedens]KAE9634064.1 pyridoxal phosphate-dependent aminotransferase [Defluviitalea raffinosedens]MBM7685806.1 aspartate aminotransferase [Defluviitalea raffinosedens]MDK2788476.1 aspartate aminotransferase [Candidatus Epulonipiscium sp.]HHW68006.1 pyridoxal phosphate-dependent aminotransferase [Candidatus Epulonipiscium sp.]
MISNKMKTLVANSSVIRAMFEEGKRLAKIHGEENVFDFSLGNPNVEPPEHIKASILKILNEESPNLVHGYMNNSGYEDVRSKIAEFINKKHGLDLSYESIVMTCGAAGGLNILLKVLLNPGEEVIVFAPFFGEYNNYVNNFDGKLVTVPPDIDTFEPNIEELKKKITSKTKAVIINSPNNPTGVVYSEKAIKELAKTLSEKEEELGISIYLISDEPYREIVYDGVEVPYILKYYKNAFIGYSYSKSLSLPGERIGYIVANPKMDDFEDIMAALNVANRILGFVNAPSLFQRVIADCLDAEVDVNIYKRNRDLLYNHLIEIGFKCIKPEGAFYLFPRTPIEDDKKFCEDAKQFNLLLVPGSTFGCPGHIRLSYCISYEKIKNSLPAFSKLAKLYNMK